MADKTTKTKPVTIAVTVDPALKDFYEEYHYDARTEKSDLYRKALTEFAVAHGYVAPTAVAK